MALNHVVMRRYMAVMLRIRLYFSSIPTFFASFRICYEQLLIGFIPFPACHTLFQCRTDHYRVNRDCYTVAMVHYHYAMMHYRREFCIIPSAKLIIAMTQGYTNAIKVNTDGLEWQNRC
jgi:hypothetical protein